MSPSIHLNKPEYFFRPQQIMQRLRRAHQAATTEMMEVVLPWGLKIRFHTNDFQGSSIWRMGLYDLCVSETIWRLLDPGEYALDVGANIGHMTSVMARRVGRAGKVLSFEPHPDIYAELKANVETWRSDPDLGQMESFQIALSSEAGTANLGITADFDHNRGTASLVPEPGGTTKSFTVQTARLDDVTDPKRHIGVFKIDVEGHELPVLMGAAGRLGRHEIRDIIFEDHLSYPTPVTDCLEKHGYRIFRIIKGFWRPIAGVPTEAFHDPFAAPNYLATMDPDRALKRLHRPLWAVLGL